MLLYINACVRKESRTKELADYLLDKFDCEKKIINLYDTNLKMLDKELLDKRNNLIATNDYNDPIFDLAKEVKNSDIILLACPYWDLSFPSIVKVYIENIMISNLTFTYENNRPKSLCNIKKLIYVTTSGGPIFNDYGYDYIKGVFNAFFNVNDIVEFKAEHLDEIGVNVCDILKNTKEQIDRYCSN